MLASTDVYADIVKQVGGDNVEVSALISSTGTDPHSYEATSSTDSRPRTHPDRHQRRGLRLFLEDLAGKDNASQGRERGQGQRQAHRREYNHLVEDHRGEHHEDGGDHAHAHEFGEHLWYDFETVRRLPSRLPRTSPPWTPRTLRPTARTPPTSSRAGRPRSLRKAISGAGKYLSTEPVPDYLISSTGAENTPSEFAEAVEAGNDVPAL